MENYKKKVTNLEIEDKINKQELDKKQQALVKAKSVIKKLQIKAHNSRKAKC